MAKNNGGPAFPAKALDGGYDASQGMSMRDWFAAAALQGWLASFTPSDGDPNPEFTAVLVYKLADAMLAERAKP